MAAVRRTEIRVVQVENQLKKKKNNLNQLNLIELIWKTNQFLFKFNFVKIFNKKNCEF